MPPRGLVVLVGVWTGAEEVRWGGRGDSGCQGWHGYILLWWCKEGEVVVLREEGRHLWQGEKAGYLSQGIQRKSARRGWCHGEIVEGCGGDGGILAARRSLARPLPDGRVMPS